MFCSRCGCENNDSSVFCKKCGNRLNGADSSQSPNPASTPVYATQPQRVKAPYSSNPVLNQVKTVAASPLALVAIIAFSAQILVEIFKALTFRNALIPALYRILNMFGGDVPYEMYSFVDKIAGIGGAPFAFATILGLIPSILICVGLWMTYASATNRTYIGMKTSGLTMIKVMNIIQIVCSSIWLLVSEIIIIVAAIGVNNLANSYSGYYYETSYSGASTVIFVMLAIVVGAIFALQIIYNAKIVSSINAAKYTVNTGVPTDKISGFVAVWSFISAFGLLFTIVTNFLGSVLGMTSLICFAILIYKYKGSMRGLMYAPQPTAPQTPVA